MRANPYRPAIAVKHMDSKRAFKRFTGGDRRDEEDRIPEGAASPKPLNRYIFRGHILDAKTLAFALTDRGLEPGSRLQALRRRARQAEGQTSWPSYA